MSEAYVFGLMEHAVGNRQVLVLSHVGEVLRPPGKNEAAFKGGECGWPREEAVDVRPSRDAHRPHALVAELAKEELLRSSERQARLYIEAAVDAGEKRTPVE